MLVESGDAAALLRSIRDDVGLGVAMGTLDNSGHGRDSSHLDDVTALLAIAAVHPDLATFEIWLREHLQGVAVGEDPRAAGQVTLSTVHRVKGLEWERVIVLGAHEGLMPHRLTDDIEEERRVFHVALTRCRTQVVLLADAAAPTPFIDDLTTEPAPILAAVPGVESRLERSRRTAPSGSFVAPAAAAGESSELVDALRAWRLERSRSDGVPAFVVLHDSTIQEIAAAKPGSARRAVPYHRHRPDQARALRERHPRDRRHRFLTGLEARGIQVLEAVPPIGVEARQGMKRSASRLSRSESGCQQAQLAEDGPGIEIDRARTRCGRPRTGTTRPCGNGMRVL